MVSICEPSFTRTINRCINHTGTAPALNLMMLATAFSWNRFA